MQEKSWLNATDGVETFLTAVEDIAGEAVMKRMAVGFAIVGIKSTGENHNLTANQEDIENLWFPLQAVMSITGKKQPENTNE